MKGFYYLLAFLFVLTSITFSQPRKAEVFVSGGMAVPLTPQGFSDFWTAGYNISGGAGYRFSPNISGNASLNYSSMAFDDEAFLTSLGLSGLGLTVSGADVSIILVTANVKFSLVPKASISPYLTGGVGFFNISADNPTVSYQGYTITGQGYSEGALSAVVGAGVDIPVSPTVSVFLEVDWGMGFTEGDVTGYMPAKGGLLILL